MSEKPVTTVLIATPEGEVSRDQWEGSTLRHLQASVGGTVDVVGLTDHVDMWVNDEGAFTQQVNWPVTAFLFHHFGSLCAPIFGPVVFACHDGAGNTVSLTQDWQQTVLVALRDCEDCGAAPGLECDPHCLGLAAFLEELDHV